MSTLMSGEKNSFFGKHYTEEERMKKSVKYRSESKYKNLITELNAHNFTYTTLAKLLGLSITSISRKMSGKRNFTLEEMVVIKNLLGSDMSVEELFKRFDD